MFPLFVRAVGVDHVDDRDRRGVAAFRDEHGMRAINRGFFISAAISAAAAS
jgi:hypothetical protein